METTDTPVSARKRLSGMDSDHGKIVLRIQPLSSHHCRKPPTSKIQLCKRHRTSGRSTRWSCLGVQRAVRDNSIRTEEIASQQRFASGRTTEDLNVRDFVDSHRGEILILVGGDFNTPASSAHFRQAWGDLTNSFSEAGWGYHFPARCDGPGLMPSGWPWIRIDHILCGSSWEVVSADAGESNGSYHRMVYASIRMKVP